MKWLNKLACTSDTGAKIQCQMCTLIFTLLHSCGCEHSLDSGLRAAVCSHVNLWPIQVNNCSLHGCTCVNAHHFCIVVHGCTICVHHFCISVYPRMHVQSTPQMHHICLWVNMPYANAQVHLYWQLYATPAAPREQECSGDFSLEEF